MKKKKVDLNYNDLIYLEKTEINSGSDGTIYKISNQYYLKFTMKIIL